jgi:hypothetical protein
MIKKAVFFFVLRSLIRIFASKKTGSRIGSIGILIKILQKTETASFANGGPHKAFGPKL